MPKLLIFTFGTRGDVQPYVALGKVLKTRGFDVTISTGQGFDDYIEGHGLSSRSASINFHDMLQRPDVQDAMDTVSGKLRLWKEAKAMQQLQHEEMLEIARELKPDLLISNAKGHVGHLIAWSQGIPSIPTLLQPFFVSTREFPPILFPSSNYGAWGNRLAHKLFNGLTRWATKKMIADWAKRAFGNEGAKMLGPYIEGYHPSGQPVPHLHGYSCHIVPKPADWGENEHVTGCWFLESNQEWTPPEDLQRFMEAGDPPVYIGFGSMPAKDAKRVTEVVIAALNRLGRRGVLATGWGGLEADENNPNLFFLDSVPHEWLFPRCAAVVHHGGAGTTHAGLRWGCPTVICAAGMDQPFWGHRIAKLGAGPKPLKLKSMTADKLASAISVALEPAALSRAKALGEAISCEDGVTKAADLVCQVVSPAPELASFTGA
jgi:sterol 3beta-glucosyltransferase